MKKLISASLAMCLVAVLMSSCNNSSSENPDASSGPGPFSVVTGNGLFAYDLQDATHTRRTITELPVRGAAMVPFGRLSLDNKAIVDLVPAFVVYVAGDKLWKTDVRQGSSLEMTQVSSASMANACLKGVGDTGLDAGILLNGESTVVRVSWQTGGADGNCSTLDDNQRFRVSIADGPAVAPQQIPFFLHPEFPLFDPNNVEAGRAEIVTVIGKQLVRYDSNYANPTTVATATSAVEVLDWQSGAMLIAVPASGLLVRIDNQLRWYARGASALSASLLDLAEGDDVADGACDLSQCVFVRSSLGTGKVSLYRIGANGEGPAQIVAVDVAATGLSSDSSGEAFSGLWGLAANSAVFSTYAKGTNPGNNLVRIYRVSKSGGTPLLLASGDFNRISKTQISSAIFAYSTTTSSGVTHLTVMGEDGTILQSLDDTIVSGAVVKFSTGEGVATGSLGPVAFTRNSSAVDVGTAGAILQAYDPASNTLGVVAGQLPAHTFARFFGFGSKLVFAARVADPTVALPVSQNDLFYVDLNAANSLQRLTDTADISEEVVF